MDVRLMEDSSTPVLVVAVALISPDRRVLMQLRHRNAEHGGLWEFPGGKVEGKESLESALLREIDEELGVELDPMSLVPLAFSSDPALPPAPRAPHVILLYTCRSWLGEPRCRQGEGIAWFAPKTLPELAMPPLDYPLAQALLARI